MIIEYYILKQMRRYQNNYLYKCEKMKSNKKYFSKVNPKNN